MSYQRSPQKFQLSVWQQAKLPRILIEGDSWADHPLVSNLSWLLHQYLDDKAHILNISGSGDLIFDMSRGKQFKKLKAYLKSSLFNFDLLFLSGGGNDILVNKNSKFKLSALLQSATSDEPESYINQSLWRDALARVGQSYERILEMALTINPNLHVVTHTYDYIYPRNVAGDIIVIPDVLGPWVWPIMNKKGITNQNMQRDIIAVLLNHLKTMLIGLADKYPQLTVVDTLGTLPVYQQWGINVPDWEDEIHPNSRGFSQLVNEKKGPAVKRLISR